MLTDISLETLRFKREALPLDQNLNIPKFLKIKTWLGKGTRIEAGNV